MPSSGGPLSIIPHLGERTQSKSAVEEAVSAIGWVHQQSGYPPVNASPLVSSTLSGLRCKLAKPRVRKEPTTTVVLAAMMDSLGLFLSLANVHLVACSLLAFAAFLRYDEVAKLRCCDILFTT